MLYGCEEIPNARDASKTLCVLGGRDNIANAQANILLLHTARVARALNSL